MSIEVSVHFGCVSHCCVAGADGSGPPGGGAGHPHPEAYCWNQLPLRRPHSGGHEHSAGRSAAVRAGIAQTHIS